MGAPRRARSARTVESRTPTNAHLKKVLRVFLGASLDDLWNVTV